jgi:hypothetical protein
MSKLFLTQLKMLEEVQLSAIPAGVLNESTTEPTEITEREILTTPL